MVVDATIQLQLSLATVLASFVQGRSGALTRQCGERCARDLGLTQVFVLS